MTEQITTRAGEGPRRAPRGRLVGVHVRANLLELLREPAFLVPTLGFPPLFFLFFAAPSVPEGDTVAAMAVVTQFVLFGVLGIVLFQFGVGIAEDRRRPWEPFLRTLPATVGVRFTARVLSALVFALVSVALTVVTGLLATDAGMPAGRWVLWLLVLVAGGVPFALLGIGLGYSARPKAVLPIINVLYLVGAFLGALWIPPQALPGIVQDISPFVPIRSYRDVVVAVATGGPFPVGHALALVGWTVVFAALAAWFYRRDEGANHR